MMAILARSFLGGQACLIPFCLGALQSQAVGAHAKNARPAHVQHPCQDRKFRASSSKGSVGTIREHGSSST